jgi:hypothetical protein
MSNFGPGSSQSADRQYAGAGRDAHPRDRNFLPDRRRPKDDPPPRGSAEVRARYNREQCDTRGPLIQIKAAAPSHADTALGSRRNAEASSCAVQSRAYALSRRWRWAPARPCNRPSQPDVRSTATSPPPTRTGQSPRNSDRHRWGRTSSNRVRVRWSPCSRYRSTSRIRLAAPKTADRGGLDSDQGNHDRPGIARITVGSWFPFLPL